MLCARSTIFTGSPLSSTKTSPHPEPEDLAARPAEIAGADHQLDRLRDGHEVAGHLRIGDGHPPATLDLAAEDRHDAPRGGQHVAETDRDEPGLRMLSPGRLRDPLR